MSLMFQALHKLERQRELAKPGEFGQRSHKPWMAPNRAGGAGWWVITIGALLFAGGGAATYGWLKPATSLLAGPAKSSPDNKRAPVSAMAAGQSRNLSVVTTVSEKDSAALTSRIHAPVVNQNPFPSVAAQPRAIKTKPARPMVLAANTSKQKKSVPLPLEKSVTRPTTTLSPTSKEQIEVSSLIKPAPVPASNDAPAKTGSTNVNDMAIKEIVLPPDAGVQAYPDQNSGQYEIEEPVSTKQFASVQSWAQRGEQQIKSAQRSSRITSITADLKQAIASNDQARVALLIEDLKALVSADSNYVLKIRAYVALTHGKYLDAERLLGRVLARDQDDVDAGLNMAITEIKTGRVQQAQQRLKILANTHPDDLRIATLLRSIQ